ncbi:transmembrane emp24 domain-containing protein [Anaeramoeba flamelloides]|uniref:Transmembrane emp24 domain-containing protein n=1 Tax=Anaeramoeba flamelloides TaxID=1746091 RepID=A0AAV7YZU9_9EUKA|nr:transmembrane emp24 domain-containing protein [Anaeramoeba flamelloides]
MQISKLVLILLFILQTTCFRFNLKRNSEQCFYEKFPNNTKVNLDCVAMSDRNSFFSLNISSKDNNTIFQKNKIQETSFSFVSSQISEYSFCFSNKDFSTQPKNNEINLYIYSRLPLKFQDLTKETGILSNDQLQQIDNFGDRLGFLADDLLYINKLLDYLKTREKVHRNTSESTNTRVLYSSFCLTFLIIIVGTGQIWYLKKSFKDWLKKKQD